MSNFKTEIDQAPKAQRSTERVDRKLTFSNLTEKQKNMLSAAGAGVAGVSLGVVAMSLMGASGSSGGGTTPPPNPSEGGEEVEITIHTDAPFADSVNDNMSFGEAFKAARSEVGAGGIFEWRGNLYNTYIKEEWDTMSAQEKAEFFASIDEEFLPGDEEKEKEIITILNDHPNVDDKEDIVIIDPDPAPGPEPEEIVIDPDPAPDLEGDIIIIQPDEPYNIHDQPEITDINNEYPTGDESAIVSDDY